MNVFNDITFNNPEFFWLFLLLPLLIIWYLLKNKSAQASFKFSNLEALRAFSGTGLLGLLKHFIFLLRLLVISLVIVVLARPQSRTSWKDVKAEGIDIIMSLDVSYSMLAKDLKPNRLEAAKEVAQEFIDERTNDRMGLIIFGGEAFTQCPLTTDHGILKSLFQEIKAGSLAEGTAIGLGIADAVARVKESKAKSKVVILLSDGVSNVGEIAPLTAGEIAKTFGVRVYTIGVGTIGKAYTPVSIDFDGSINYDYVDVQIDEPMMKQVAEMTGGKYFRATDKSSLRAIYKEIDKLEKTIIEEKSFSNKAERYFPFALWAGILFFLEFLLKYLVLRSLT